MNLRRTLRCIERDGAVPVRPGDELPALIEADDPPPRRDLVQPIHADDEIPILIEADGIPPRVMRCGVPELREAADDLDLADREFVDQLLA